MPDTGEFQADIARKVVSGSGPSEYVVCHAGRSQYSRIGGGVSACGLAALNCARIILEMEKAGLVNEHIVREMMKRETLEEVLRPCLSWSSPAHLDVDEICTAPIFKRSLKLLHSDYSRPGLSQFKELLLRLSQQTAESHSSTCAIITRPPEIIACIKLATNKSDVYVVFDSHPRPNKHPQGAAFIFMNSIDATAAYLADLLHYDDSLLMDSSVQWQAQLLAHFSAHVFTAQRVVDSAAELVEASLQASLEVLNLRARIVDLENRNKNLLYENEQLLQDVARLDDEVDELKAKERQARLSTRKSFRDVRLPWTAPRGMQETSSLDKGKGKALYDQDIVDSAKSPRVTVEKGPHSQNSDLPHESSQNDHVAAYILQMQMDQYNNHDSMLATAMQRQFDEENHRLTKEKHSLKGAAFGVFRCGICFDNFNQDVVARVEPCRHQFCRECMYGYATGKVDEHRYPIICPICAAEKERKDAGIIDNTLIQQLGISEKQYEVFVEMQMAAFSVILHCRRCENSAFVDKKEYEAAEILVCPMRQCNYAWCRACSQEIEIGGPQHSCDGTSELKHLMAQRGWKYCPGCQTPAEKIDGCNPMTCMSPGCNTHFCYTCGEAITQSVLRQQIRSAISTHYSRCRLFEG